MISGFADGIVLRTKSGIVKLYFSELPKEVQEGMNVARPSTLPAAIEKTKTRFATPRLQRLRCEGVD
jgi:hypothetical protein